MANASLAFHRAASSDYRYLEKAVRRSIKNALIKHLLQGPQIFERSQLVVVMKLIT